VRKIFAASALAMLLIFGCVQGANWQYERHQLRHAKNELIKQNAVLKEIPESAIDFSNFRNYAWRIITLSGHFVPEKELLVRNRYHEGKYGFGVVTLFKSDSERVFWIDRGWVVAGKDAQTPPVTQKVTDEKVSITARIRVENIENQISGSVFAVPGQSQAKLEKWNSELAVKTAPFYLDLITAGNPRFTPDAPTALPEISDGPHLAYTFQWIIFAFLVVLAWFLVIREERKAQLEKL
jgi:cytochrome oxidase assembly protein ShyY1